MKLERSYYQTLTHRTTKSISNLIYHADYLIQDYLFTFLFVSMWGRLTIMWIYVLRKFFKYKSRVWFETFLETQNFALILLKLWFNEILKSDYCDSETFGREVLETCSRFSHFSLIFSFHWLTLPPSHINKIPKKPKSFYLAPNKFHDCCICNTNIYGWIFCLISYTFFSRLYFLIQMEIIMCCMYQV